PLPYHITTRLLQLPPHWPNLAAGYPRSVYRPPPLPILSTESPLSVLHPPLPIPGDLASTQCPPPPWRSIPPLASTQCPHIPLCQSLHWPPLSVLPPPLYYKSSTGLHSVSSTPLCQSLYWPPPPTANPST
ncbi:unnamed protein product, partial [Staurois parvus]